MNNECRTVHPSSLREQQITRPTIVAYDDRGDGHI